MPCFPGLRLARAAPAERRHPCARAASVALGLLACLLPATSAQAQVAAGVTVATNQIFRGQSVSSDGPAASLALSYDHPSGAFTGASFSMAVDDGGPVLNANTQYVGYALRRGQTSYEIGAVRRAYRYLSDRDYARSYLEGFVGVSRGRTSARLFASTNYHRDKRATFYGEVNTTLIERKGWSINGHAGVSLVPGHNGGSELRAYPDWKIDASRSVGKFFVGVGVAGTSYPVVAPDGKPRLFAVLSRAF